MLRSLYLKGEIVRAGMTLGQFADELGMSSSTLVDRMAGRTEFKRSEIERTIHLLDLSDQQVLDIFFAKDVS